MWQLDSWYNLAICNLAFYIYYPLAKNLQRMSLFWDKTHKNIYCQDFNSHFHVNKYSTFLNLKEQ